jgi:antitoxin (DNA-binding transcriptional repressor) of toxin-antitoxin stability system
MVRSNGMSGECQTDGGELMDSLTDVENKPLGRLLGGVNASVFAKRPHAIGLRELQRDMSSVLGKLRTKNEYRVLTNRGVPSFLLIPIDPGAWSSLLAAAPPETEFEREIAADSERTGRDLPNLDTVLEPIQATLR